jgi:hypothetical protein
VIDAPRSDVIEQNAGSVMSQEKALKLSKKPQKTMSHGARPAHLEGCRAGTARVKHE